MAFFFQIPDARALLRCKGVFKQVDLFRGPQRRIYAKWGSGFIRIAGADGTSIPTVTVEQLDLPFEPDRGQFSIPLVPTDFSQE